MSNGAFVSHAGVAVSRSCVPQSEIGPYDNFFHLGGTSIQALAMVNLLRVRLQKTAAQFDQSVAHAKVQLFLSFL